jgi:putative sigma-54 modulation protein
MQVMVTFRNTKPTEGLRQHAIDKVERVNKFIRRPIEAHVILSVVKRRHIAEVQVMANHLNITAKEETGDLYSAIDLAVSKLERQAKKHASKVKHHKGVNSTAANAPAPEVKRPTVLRARRVAVRSMRVDDAVTELDGSEAGFFLFENVANGALSLIYRRDDGKYGLIEPDLA